jgi:hypothetical protein
VQCQDNHISTCFNKDTRELFMLCILCLCCYHYPYLFICALCLLLSFIYFVHCSTLLFILLFNFVSSILLLLLFIVHCFKEKSSILTLDYVQEFWSCCPAYNIIYTSQQTSYFVNCSTLLFILLFNFVSSILLLLLFIVHCFKEKSSILTLDYVQVFRSRCSSIQHHLYESINIIQQTPPTLS